MLPVSAREIVRFTPPRYDLAAVQIEQAKAEAELLNAPEDAEAERKLIQDRIDVLAATAAMIEKRIEEIGGQAPVYLLRVPTVSDRARVHREMAAAGCVWPDDKTIATALRMAIRESGAANADELVALVDQIESGQVADQAELLRYVMVETAARVHPVYAGLQSQRVHWGQMSPVIYGRMFLVGWEGIADAFKAAGGIATEEALGVIPWVDLTAIGGKIDELLYLKSTHAKN